MRLARWLCLLLLVLTAACTSTGLPAAPSTTPVVLFQDDFSDPSSGWDRYQEEAAVLDYENGVYHIQVNVPNYDVWSNPGLQFTDVRIEVDAGKIGGPDDNDFGVLCRYQPDSQNHYAFLISSDGYFGIVKVKDKKRQVLNADSLVPSDAIAQGIARNHITAVCQGNTLTLAVNGEHLATVQDDEFPAGDVGLLAGTFATPGTSIVFDNFSVLQP